MPGGFRNSKIAFVEMMSQEQERGFDASVRSIRRVDTVRLNSCARSQAVPYVALDSLGDNERKLRSNGRGLVADQVVEMAPTELT